MVRVIKGKIIEKGSEEKQKLVLLRVSARFELSSEGSSYGSRLHTRMSFLKGFPLTLRIRIFRVLF